MIDYKYADLYYEDSINKQLKIEAEDGSVITNEDIFSEAMTLDESLCSDTSLNFGCCEASKFYIKIANRFTQMYGQWLTVTETIDGNEDDPFLFGHYKVHSDNPTADRTYREITAYDAMYDIINADGVDVADWYNEILPDYDSTVTLKKFRQSFLEHLGIEELDANLVNDDMIVEKTIETSSLSGQRVITAICEINGVFAHITREGKLEYIQLEPIEEDKAFDIPINMSSDYEDFETQTINCLQIREDDTDPGVVYGSGANRYIISGNFLLYGKTTEDLITITENLYPVINNISYRPATITAPGNPCLEVGDVIRLSTTYQEIYTYVLQRKFSGIQALTDTYTSDGTETYVDDGGSLQEKIEQIKSRTSELAEEVRENTDAISIAVEMVEADYANILILESEIANIQTLFAEYATIQQLEAALAQINELYVDYEEVVTLIADFATIEDLEALYANISLLDADVANIEALLAGEAGVGELESIHLTVKNAIIDEAVIVDALIDTVIADIIQSNIIYTDYITIMSENGGIVIAGTTMQISDSSGTVRLQLGEDADGNFTFVLYDGTGTGIMIDSEGIHASAVPDGLIVNDMVADDAAIAGSKLDIESVSQCLNDAGLLEIDAAKVIINGETLDYQLAQITQQIEDLEMAGIDTIENWYAIGGPDNPPCEPGESFANAILGELILGESILGCVSWTTESLTSHGEDEYVWFTQKITYIDGTVVWTTPTLLTDDYVRNAITIQQTELSVIQGQIQAKIWLSDIESATDEIWGDLSIITDQYSELTLLIDTIDMRVGEMQTTYGDYFTELYSQVESITLEQGQIAAKVEEIDTKTANAITEGTPYYAISENQNYYPPHEVAENERSILGELILGSAILGVSGNDWTTEQPEYKEGQYIWISYYRERVDGTTYWTTPTLLTDEWLRKNASEMSEKYSQWVLTIDSALLEVYSAISTVEGNITELNASIREYVDETSADILSEVAGLYVTDSEFASVTASIEQYIDQETASVLIEVSQTLIDYSKIDETVAKVETYYAVSNNPDSPTNQIAEELDSVDLTEGLPSDWTTNNSTNNSLAYVNHSTLGGCYRIMRGGGTLPNIASSNKISFATGEKYRVEFEAATDEEYVSIAVATCGLSAYNHDYATTSEGDLKEYWQEFSLDFETTGDRNGQLTLGNYSDYTVGAYVYFKNAKLSSLSEEEAEWSPDYPSISAGQYIWVRNLITYVDGTQEWTEPYCISSDVDLSDYPTMSIMNASIEAYIGDSESYILSQVEGNYVTNGEFTQSIASIEAYVDESMAQISLTVSTEGGTYEYYYITPSTFPDSWTKMGTSLGTFEEITDPILGDCYGITCTSAEATNSHPLLRFNLGSYLPSGTYHLKVKMATLEGHEDTARGGVAFAPISGSYTLYLTAEGSLKSDEWTEFTHDFEVESITTEDWCVRLAAYSLNDTILFKDPELLFEGERSGALGGYAGITISSNGQELSSSMLDLSSVRQAFANDPSAITISAGTITFLSKALVIYSDQFTLDINGNAEFGGTLNAVTGTFDTLYTLGHDSYRSQDSGVYLSDGISAGKNFRVDSFGITHLYELYLTSDIYVAIDYDAYEAFYDDQDILYYTYHRAFYVWGTSSATSSLGPSLGIGDAYTYYELDLDAERVYLSADNIMISLKDYDGITMYGDTVLWDDLRVWGTKNRVVETEHFGLVEHFCYETASPYFGDMGMGTTDDNGECYISLDEIFIETIGESCEYLIFLTPTDAKGVYVDYESITREGFIVEGSPGAIFYWEVRAKQRGYENYRLDNVNDVDNDSHDTKECDKELDQLSHEMIETAKEEEIALDNFFKNEGIS